ncbi:hypothetical protein CIB95_00245 [Lottiidibacillus patelloidae]|uniref:Uncharacterized protein n=1 Tax=Lottiidibacillus patelloidae TaxID=2670334 RepID=A0A263BWF8_9BACI|nr:hypothetical protein [Lottiidibacillus patelloidae]OZM58045.1 hypothetical protein CIB95_00245 [Lottiidibacillus patelloidae]
MKEFHFTLETNSRNTFKKVNYATNVIIEASSIREAIRQFTTQEDLKYIGITKLMNSNSYRVFLLKKSKIVGAGKELVYLVKEDDGLEFGDLHLEYINE